MHTSKRQGDRECMTPRSAITLILSVERTEDGWHDLLERSLSARRCFGLAGTDKLLRKQQWFYEIEKDHVLCK